MGPRAFCDKQTMMYYLVYLDEQGKSVATTRKGNVTKRCLQLASEYAHLEHGLWGVSEDMGKTEAEVDKNIRRAITQRLHERDEKMESLRQQWQKEQAERERQEQEALAQRKALAGTKDRMTIKPFDIMQRMEDAEVILEQLKPGAYYLCIDYKKKGALHLTLNVRKAIHLNVFGMVEREDKATKASLHRFAMSVRNLYRQHIDIIGRTQAIKTFGQKLTDSVPHIQEAVNPHYSTSAPRRYYDRYTLEYLAKENEDIRNKKREAVASPSLK